MKLRIVFTEADSPDCEYGCWTTGYGVKMFEENDILLHLQEPWATCQQHSRINWKALLDDIIELQSSYTDVTIDLGEDPEDNYPQWFLEALM